MVDSVLVNGCREEVSRVRARSMGRAWCARLRKITCSLLFTPPRDRTWTLESEYRLTSASALLGKAHAHPTNRLDLKRLAGSISGGQCARLTSLHLVADITNLDHRIEGVVNTRTGQSSRGRSVCCVVVSPRNSDVSAHTSKSQDKCRVRRPSGVVE